MKTNLSALICFVMSSSAFATVPKILVCTTGYAKLAMSSESRELYVGSMETKDEDVVSRENEHGRASMYFDAQLNQFNGSGEDGCVQVEYITQTDAQGNTVLLENADGVETTFPCQWLK